MNRLFLAITLLLASTAYSNQLPTGTAIPAPIIHGLDGTINIMKIVAFRARISEVLQMNYSTNPGQTILLKDLVAQEHSVDPAKVDGFRKKCLSEVVRMMHDEGYIKEFYAISPVFQEIVDIWAKQHRKEDSVFYKFAKSLKQPNTEYETVTTLITSLRIYDIFLHDLQQFLTDLIASFPKSYAIYQECVARVAQQHAARQ